MAKFRKSLFTSPENLYSTSYFWVINRKMDVKRLCSQLDDMAAHGIRAVCLHPFPKGFRPVTMPSTMEPDYMTPEYMEILTKVMEHAAALGMNAWLYDEGGWPSGGCCGQVWASDKKRFAIRFKKLDDDGAIVDGVAQYDPNYSAPVPSVIEPGVTEKFIELTHEKWLKCMRRLFGKTIRFTFTDEPNMYPYLPDNVMTWTTDFADVFKAEKGYDITEHLDALLSKREPTEEEKRIRIDYCDVRANLFRDRFLKPIQDWCHKNGILSGGHLNGEDEPRGNTAYGYGSILRGLRALDVPGVDVIWRQLYPGKKDNRPFPKYASSAAHQTGSRFVLSESFGIYGYNTTPDVMKWLIDYQLVRGVNIFVIGYSASETNGMFMDSMEPNFTPQNTLWDFMGPLYRYAERVGSVLANGKPAQKTAVLYDIHSIWAGGKDAALAIDRHFDVSRKLLEEQRDFDYIDDEQIAAATITKDGEMRIGKMSYSVIVTPTFKWLSEKALEKLESFEKHGGLILDSQSLNHAPKTCSIRGKGSKNLRVIKRLYDDKAAYFIVNESDTETVTARVGFDEKAPVVLCDTDTGKFIEVPSKDGCFTWTFPPFASALFMTNVAYDVPAKAPVKTLDVPLDHGWTIRKASTYRAGKTELEAVAENGREVSVALGDWRPLFGDSFSGKAVYSVSFTSEIAADAVLDLGRVCYCASVRLNGRELPPRF
ncbi:MAG: hypothetical protein J5833_05580, partial [Victivallales bacterium]|nr:hypothetical protein [Victivallales bacterium]